MKTSDHEQTWMTMDKAGVKQTVVVGHSFLWIPIDFGELVRSGIHTLALGRIEPARLLLKAQCNGCAVHCLYPQYWHAIRSCTLKTVRHVPKCNDAVIQCAWGGTCAFPWKVWRWRLEPAKLWWQVVTFGHCTAFPTAMVEVCRLWGRSPSTIQS